MARPGLHNHPKFRRLVQLLSEPVPHVHGYLECIWLVSYENGDPFIGDQTDIELAAQWAGEPGKLCRALLTCGGGHRAGFIEPAEGSADAYQIHDLHHHAPEYVSRRKSKEEERRKKKVCAQCSAFFHSTETHAKFCSSACRSANFRSENATGNGQKRSETEPSVRVTERNAPPAPAPAPAPALNTLPFGEGGSESSKAVSHEKPKRNRNAYEAEFENWYTKYPFRTAKLKAAKAYEAAIKRIAEDRAIDLDTAAQWLLERTIEYAKSPKGRSGIGAGYPASWLNAGSYDDDPAVWQQWGGQGPSFHQSGPAPREITRPIKRQLQIQETQS